jgi:signal peptidase I
MVMKRGKRIFLWLLAALAALLLVGRFIATPYVVPGDSMLPTLKPWELCLMARRQADRPRRGEIVMFRTADDPPLYFIKRFVGLAGETVAIRQGIVTVNGQPLDEPYAAVNPDWEMEPVAVPPATIFVLCDNRSVPLEDTLHGLVATRLVTGRLLGHWRWKP